MPTAPAQRATAVPNDLEAYWLPFTPNRAFKAAPRLIARAKDMHYYTPDGRAVLDGTAGIGAPHAGDAVEHGAPVGGVVMHVLGARDQPRRRLERPVGRERKPIGFEVVGDGGRSLCWCR